MRKGRRVFIGVVVGAFAVELLIPAVALYTVGRKWQKVPEAEESAQLGSEYRENTENVSDGENTENVSDGENTENVSDGENTENVSLGESDGEWFLVLVNGDNPIDAVPDITLTRLSYDVDVDSRMYPDLQKMMDDARAEGLSPMICSGLRSFEEQRVLYADKVEEYISEGLSRYDAEKEAARWVAVPGTSEHHTGLAVDIVSVANQRLDESQEYTPEQLWLRENSWKYGFILRYQKNKTEITGVYYEPWHYRYVGHDAAAEIFRRGITLEEYLETR